jgi:hypothetical protein
MAIGLVMNLELPITGKHMLSRLDRWVEMIEALIRG